MIWAKTLFHHYHELNEMADLLPRVRNLKVDVREYGKGHFLHTVTHGSADHRGIGSRNGGLPDEVTSRRRNHQNLERSAIVHGESPRGPKQTAIAGNGTPPR